MEEELKARMEALTQVGSQVGRVLKMLPLSQKTSIFFTNKIKIFTQKSYYLKFIFKFTFAKY